MPKRAQSKNYLVAKGLRDGLSQKKACEAAGYSKSYANAKAHVIVKSQGVAVALAELGQGLRNDTLGSIAKARLYEDLVTPPKGDKGAKARLGFIRTGLEVAGQIGGASELHLHQHNTLPPAVQKMLEDKMKEILGVEDGRTIIPEGTEGASEDADGDEGLQDGPDALGV